jgi:tetratricopeptide (TPR) repeat protein
LLGLLDGLPLAIAQAAAFLQESGYDFKTYIECYEDQWKELMNSRDWEGAPLQDYPDRSVWTTWAISYSAIRERHVPAANLLLLWAFLDSKDLWYSLFAAACSNSKTTARCLSEWIGDLAINEVEFAKAIQLLRNYSLIEDVEGRGSYATHLVVHRWAYYFQGEDSRAQLARLAVMVTGWAVPDRSSLDYSLQHRLLSHAQVCSQWVLTDEMRLSSLSHERVSTEIHVSDELVEILDSIHYLGSLYNHLGKLAEAEQMYERALQGKEKALGAEHTSTLGTINNLGLLYTNQGKLAEAEQMFKRALHGYEKALGAEHTSTLGTINNLGLLYTDLGKLAEAEQMYERALHGYEKALGTDNAATYIPALNAMRGLGCLFHRQADFLKARIMYSKALAGYEKVSGPDDSRSQNLRNNIRALDADAETEALKTAEEPVSNSRGETSHLGVGRASSVSRRYKLLKKLGLR